MPGSTEHLVECSRDAGTENRGWFLQSGCHWRWVSTFRADLATTQGPGAVCFTPAEELAHNDLPFPTRNKSKPRGPEPSTVPWCGTEILALCLAWSLCLESFPMNVCESQWSCAAFSTSSRALTEGRQSVRRFLCTVQGCVERGFVVTEKPQPACSLLFPRDDHLPFLRLAGLRSY